MARFYWFQLVWLGLPFDSTFREKVVEMEGAHTSEIFWEGFDASHLQELSTNQFYRVTGK